MLRTRRGTSGGGCGVDLSPTALAAIARRNGRIHLAGGGAGADVPLWLTGGQGGGGAGGGGESPRSG